MARGLWYPPGLIYDGLLEPFLRRIRKKVRKLIIKNDLFPVLDLCCGPGAQVHSLSGKGKLAWGLDINLAMLKYASGRRPGIPFLCADATDAPFGPAAFKGIILSFSLHEKRASLRPPLLAEARRLLMPEGRIVLVDFERPWNKASKLAYLYVWVIERLAGKEHFRDGREFLRAGGLRALLRENGLEELDRHNVSVGTCAVVLAAPR
ncbi:MAG: methyltransferase domain-containing protein [Candidatus Aminicenantales bacterium]